MKAIRLTLLCHALTLAQKNGCLARPDDALLSDDSPLRPEAAVRLLSAPERRATQTAQWLAPAVPIVPALADCNLGCWQGLALKQLQAQEPDALARWLADPSSAPHGGESFEQVCARVQGWLQAFDSPGDWLAVTHPWVIRAALASVLDCAQEAALRIDVLPLSRVTLSFTGQWRLRLG